MRGIEKRQQEGVAGTSFADGQTVDTPGMKHKERTGLEVVVKTELEETLHRLSLFGNSEEAYKISDGATGQSGGLYENPFAGAVREWIAVRTCERMVKLLVEVLR
jgi:hypothetical protein